MIIFSLLFILGAVIEAYFIVKGRVPAASFLIPIAVAVLFGLFVFTMIPNSPSSMSISLMIFFFIFSIVFYILFRDIALQKINALTLLSFSLIFWYVALLHFEIKSIWLLALLIPSAGALIASFIKLKLSAAWKTFFYIWFIAIEVFLILFFFTQGESSLFSILETAALGQKMTGDLSLHLNFFFAGMVSIYLSMGIYSLFSFTPFVLKPAGPIEKIDVKKELEDIRKSWSFLSQKYSDKEAKPSRSLILIILQIGIFYFNYQYNIISDYILIAVFILYANQFLSPRRQDSPEAEPYVASRKFKNLIYNAREALKKK